MQRLRDRRCAIDVALDERDARAQASALIEYDDVLRERANGRRDVRRARDPGDAHPRAVTAYTHAWRSLRAHLGDRLVASVDVDLALRDGRDIELFVEPNRRVTEIVRRLDERA